MGVKRVTHVLRHARSWRGLVEVASPALLLVASSSCSTPVDSHRAGSDATSAARASSTSLVDNSDFERGGDGWTFSGASVQVVPGRGGGRAVQLGAPSGSSATWGGLEQTSARTDLPAATQVRATVWVHSQAPGQRVRLRLAEVAADSDVERHGDAWSDVRTVGTGWNRLTTVAVAHGFGSAFRVLVSGRRLQDSTLTVDDVAVAPVSSPITPVSASSPTLSNGCQRNRRGVPVCSAYVGGAYGGNSSASRWEAQLAHGLGVRRTYWGPGDRAKAVRVAREDLAHRRLPWISFKLPYSWSAMASGRGDLWLSGLARDLATLPGPVWLTLHHEPEGDGPILDWKRMQEHCAPLVRTLAPNVGYAVILTGWNQLYGPERYRLDNMWPRTKIDVAGFDVYNFHGTYQGSRRLPREDTTAKYLKPLARWATDHRIPWALGETGLTAHAAAANPSWMRRTARDMVNLGGVAFSYFNSGLNSTSDWRLNTARKQRQFRDVHRLAPRL